MFKSATITLMLWYVLLSVGLSLLFSGVLYHFSTNELSEALHNQYQTIANNDHDSDNQKYTTDHELVARSHNLLADLVYFNLFVLAGSTVVSYGLARRTLRPIEEAHLLQTRFIAEASHELRTPLTAIKADTEATLMQRGSNSSELRRTLKGNLRDIEKLELLTNHLLEISLYKNVSPLKKDVNLDQLIRHVLKQLKPSITAKHLRIDAETQPIQIKASQHDLQRLITIVLDNAVKYSHANGRVTVKLHQTKQHATIRVIDGGLGIRAEDLPHIYEPFYRSNDGASAHNKVFGFGLGLSLAREIVVAHNGVIVVESKIHEGTSVTITLPKA